MKTTNLEEIKQQALKEVKPEIAAMLNSAKDYAYINAGTVEKTITSPKFNKQVTKEEMNEVRRFEQNHKKKRTFIMPTDEEIKKMKKEKKSNKPFPSNLKKPALTEDQIITKYPHAIKGTLQEAHDGHARSIEAKLKCGHIKRCHIGDLWITKQCDKCKEKKTKK